MSDSTGLPLLCITPYFWWESLWAPVWWTFHTDACLEAIGLFADINNALMAIPNLIGLLLLNRIVVGMVKDYFKS